MRPKRVCSMPHCPNLTEGGRCDECRKGAQGALQERRGTSAQRGYGARHRKWRKIILARDPICRGCDRAPSRIADHIVPLEFGGDWEIENGQGLCWACHEWKKRREREDETFGRALREAGAALGEPAPVGWRYA